MITVDPWLLSFLIFIILLLVAKILEMRHELKRQKRVHDMEIYHLKMDHGLKLIGKDLDILKERTNTIRSDIRCLDESFKNTKAFLTLMRFRLWWQTQGKYEFAIVRRWKSGNHLRDVPLIPLK